MHKKALTIIIIIIGLSVTSYFVYFSLPFDIIERALTSTENVETTEAPELESEPVDESPDTSATTTVNAQPDNTAPTSPPPAANTINISYTDTGFAPANIEIKVGSKIVFKNESSRPFWVASDSHPAHDVLPEFDQGTAVTPGKNYEFVFEKEGIWPYHNHLRPSEGGEITVSK